MSDPHPNASDAFGASQSKVRWWAGAGVRLPALLVCLALAVFALLDSGSPLVSPATGGSENRSKSCVTPAPPTLRRLRLRALVALRRGLLGVMNPLAHSRYEWGTIAPAAVWDDESPTRSSSTYGLWPSSYEMRAWSADPEVKRRFDNVVADVFEFPDSGSARKFFEEATSVRCRHRAGVVLSASPPGSSDLVWLNPDNATQYDVFLRRGELVYRLAEVRIKALTPKREERVMLARVNRLACALPQAGCSSRRRLS